MIIAINFKILNMSFLRYFMSLGSAKELPSLTNFLVNNPAFRHFAMKTHQNKQSMLSRVEQYLDKEILGKESKTPEKPLGLNTRGRN